MVCGKNTGEANAARVVTLDCVAGSPVSGEVPAVPA
jgi:hypothetical protein